MPTSHSDLGWTPSQRRALILLLTIFLLVLVVRYARDRAFVPDPQPARGVRADELASRVDPNTVDWETLAAIPMLGEKRAKEIVAYRDHLRTRDGTPNVFKEPRDLLRVRGIGLSMIENLRPYLIFPPPDRPATVP